MSHLFWLRLRKRLVQSIESRDESFEFENTKDSADCGRGTDQRDASTATREGGARVQEHVAPWRREDRVISRRPERTPTKNTARGLAGPRIGTHQHNKHNASSLVCQCWGMLPERPRDRLRVFRYPEEPRSLPASSRLKTRCSRLLAAMVAAGRSTCVGTTPGRRYSPGGFSAPRHLRNCLEHVILGGHQQAAKSVGSTLHKVGAGWQQAR